MNVSTKQQRVAKLARENRTTGFTSLNHYIDYEWLHHAYKLTRKDGATGVDGVTAQEYEQHLETNLKDLLIRIKTGKYTAPAIRRVYIPKGNGGQRPLGIPTIEDKIVQRAVVMLLEPIYEQEFYECSFGFRKGRSAHDALRSLRNNIMDNGGRWVFEVDIQKYFDTISHKQLREFLAKRVTDGVIRKLIDKWLKAGILESGQLHHPNTGTPQGGVISPLLANIYLHYVLDEWFAKDAMPRMKGKCSVTRFADDFVMVFEHYTDCYRVQNVIHKRFERFNLTLHPDKTKRIDFRFAYRTENRSKGKAINFDFLGFTHYWGKSRNGKNVVLQKTEKSRLSRAIKEINVFCRDNRHKKVSDQVDRLNKKLVGHYAYFGITGNHKSLRSLHHQTCRLWHKWLSRRSRKSYIPWDKFNLILKRFPPAKPKIYHQYQISHQAARQ